MATNVGEGAVEVLKRPTVARMQVGPDPGLRGRLDHRDCSRVEADDLKAHVPVLDEAVDVVHFTLSGDAARRIRPESPESIGFRRRLSRLRVGDLLNRGLSDRFHGNHLRQASVLHEDDARFAGLLADSDLLAEELLADDSHEKAVGDRLRVRYGRRFRFEHDWAATVARERGNINKESVLVPSYPILDSRHDAVSDDRVVPGVANQTERKTYHEYPIALDRLDALAEGGADVTDEHLSVEQIPSLRQGTAVQERCDCHVRTARVEGPCT